MKSECIESLVKEHREIEFSYEGNRYSITYYNDKRKNYISICQFYKTPIDVGNVSELLKIKIGNHSLKEIFESLPDSAFDIY